MLFVVFAIVVVAVVLMQGKSLTSTNTNTNSNVKAHANHNVNVATNASNKNANTNSSAFMEAHGWYTPVLDDETHSDTSSEGQYTYDFDSGNAIIDLPAEYASMLVESYGEVSSIQATIGDITFEIVTGTSPKDGSTLTYAAIPYTTGRVLVVRGSSRFIGDVTDSLLIK
ncbi:MAG: hypothetical protein KIH62_000210 [Candidatus Kerfeldbacteria bacterium]|nr:hypothetical protein [Candidatus Kerfeldbacteria bacterium]